MSAPVQTTLVLWSSEDFHSVVCSRAQECGLYKSIQVILKQVVLRPHFEKMLVLLWVILIVSHVDIICSKKSLVFPCE